MSQQNVVDFFTQAENDSTLKQRIQAVTNKEDFLKLAQESGYSFTVDELKAVAKEAESDELNEAELEAVAGGGSGFLGWLHKGVNGLGRLIGTW